MHGIPGFEAQGAEAEVGGVAPIGHVPLAESDAIAIARELYDLVVSQATRFDTERDDTFRLDAAGGTFVLKIAHPADTLQALQFETQAVDYATRADASLPLTRILPSVSGDLVPALPSHGGRRARLMTWLPGTRLTDEPPTDEQIGELGRTLGRLTNALRGFDRPAAHRRFAWDALSFPALGTIAQTVGNDLTARVFERFDDRIRPRLDELPHQVIHNDFNPGNVLVDPDGARYVTGIIDFGDTIHTARICDLSVALSYQMFPLGRSFGEVEPFIEAYRAVVPLEASELELLPDLVAVRFAQRILIYLWMQRGDATSLDFGTQGNLAALETLLKETS